MRLIAFAILAGRWRATVREEVMETGEIVGAAGGSAAATVKMPKGVRIQGSGSSATRLRISSESGDLSLEPMAMVFGEWTEHAGGRVIATRIPASTDLSGTDLRQHDFPSVIGGADGTLSAVWLSYHDRREELNFRQRTPEGAWTRLIPVGRYGSLGLDHLSTRSTCQVEIMTWSPRGCFVDRPMHAVDHHPNQREPRLASMSS